MSNEAPAWFVEQYNNRVMHKFQSKGFKLMGTVMPAGRIEGSKAYFPVAGKGTARKKVRGVRAVPMNASRENVEAVLDTFEAFDNVYTYDLSRMNVNEREVVQTTGANALGRAVDTEMFSAFEATAPAAGSQFVDGGVDGFSLEYALTMCMRLQEQEVDWDGNVFCPLPSLFWNQLLAFKQFNSSDYVGPDLPFTKSTTAKTWNGVHWFLGTEDWFSVPAANRKDIFLYHKSAFGWGNNVKLLTIWDWDNKLGAWDVRMESEGADAALLPEGIIRGRFATNTAIVAN